MRSRILLPGSLLTLLVDAAAAASICAAYSPDSSNAYIFGSNGDYALGSTLNDSSTWQSLSNLTSRPPWTGNRTQCFTNQFTNGLYVLNADESNPSNAYIFDFSLQSWSVQETSGEPDYEYAAILVSARDLLTDVELIKC